MPAENCCQKCVSIRYRCRTSGSGGCTFYKSSNHLRHYCAWYINRNGECCNTDAINAADAAERSKLDADAKSE